MTITKTAVSNGLKSTAIYSPCEFYRYSLHREIGEGPTVAFIGLNPSTATELQNDPTVTRCINYARHWGYGRFFMLNAFAYRSTDPAGLNTVADPAGEHCDQYILEGVRESQLVICCWGLHARRNNRHQKLREILAGRDLHVLKLTKDGIPNHPLYLKKDLTPLKWS